MPSAAAPAYRRSDAGGVKWLTLPAGRNVIDLTLGQ
jgi:hypothetical protein